MLTILSLIVSLIIWEFYVEELLEGPLEVFEEPEDPAIKWEFVTTAVVASVLSLIVPFLYLFRLQKVAEDAYQELSTAKTAAEQASTSKSEFIANVSHDLRSPLNAILGFTEMMKERVFGQLGDPHYDDYVVGINESGTLILNLVNDILDISKIEAGKYELVEEVVDITNCIKASVTMHTMQAETKNIRLNHTMDQTPLRLFGDEKAINQILNNLISNAIKFTHSDGEITVNSWICDTEKLNVQVSDTGMGMSREDIDKALSPYGQVDRKQARKHEGTGLGLYLCCQLVDLHSGELSFDSEVGKGTTVTVRFPSQRIESCN